MGLDFNKPSGGAASQAAISAASSLGPSSTGEIEHPLDELLDDAHMAASTDWEKEFVADQLVNREKYGARWQPTDGMVGKLREIAEGWKCDDRPWRGSIYEFDRQFDDDISDLFKK